MEKYLKLFTDYSSKLATTMREIELEKERLAKSCPDSYDISFFVASMGMQQHSSWNALWETRLSKLYKRAEKMAKQVEILRTKI